MRTQTNAMRNFMVGHDRCELCGSKRGIEAHHIIPIAFGGPDIEENLLCVCTKCHALLTPRSLLTKIGIHKCNYEHRFWKHFNDIAEAGETFTAIDVMDYVEQELFPIFRANKRR